MLEYALGLDPNVPSPNDSLGVSLRDNYLTLAYRRQPGATDLRFLVEFSFDLIAWTGGAVFVSSAANPDGTVTEVWRSPVPATGNSQFARLRVTLE